MNQRTRYFLRTEFRRYYAGAEIELPPDFSKREWGFIFFDGFQMERHKAFSSESEAINYIRETVPAHAYHSSAIYSYPGSSSMKEKEWLGADLIFDLDADHLPGKKGSYEEMLGHVKAEAIKLLDFLMNDFGFEEEMIKIVFSGGRGYHIHVRDPRIRSLGSVERREIIDYLSGRGMDVLIEKRVEGDFGYRKRGKSFEIFSESSWGRKIHKGLLNFLEEIGSMEEEAVMKELKGMRMRKKDVKNLIRISRDEKMMKKIEKGILDIGIPRSVWKKIIERERINLEGTADEPVTADVKRLIRLPTSLHGGTGLCVKPVDLHEMKNFDPLNDAVVFGKEEVEVSVSHPFKIRMLDEEYEVGEGKKKLPKHVAIFMMCRGIAEYGF